MHPSNGSGSRGGSRTGSVKYAHSPYVYRTTIDDAPVSPMSDQGRPDPCAVPPYRSPRSLSQSAGGGQELNNSSQAEALSQPSSPLAHSSGPQEFSQPIQVGSAPNVHARYRRGMQSPMTRANNDSNSRSGFPSSPAGSLPPRSPFTAREESASAFSGGESAPVRGPNNPYRMNSGSGFSAPQYSLPLSGGYRVPGNANMNSSTSGGGGGGGGSGSQSPSPRFAAAPPAPSGHPSSGATAGDYYASPPPPGMQNSGNGSSGAAPPYGSNTGNNSHNNSMAAPSYAPSGFSMPPAMASAAQGTNSGSYHGSPSGRAGGGGGSLSGSYVDPRASHPSSPMMAGSASGRPQLGSSFHNREPISPTHTFNNSGTHGGHYPQTTSPNHSTTAPPPTFATAVQQQHSNAFAVGSFPGRRSGPGAYATSPLANHGSPNGGGVDPSGISESYGTNTKTLSTMADDTMSSSGKSGSSASSIRDDLPLCPNDDACTLINDRKHQKKYAHTCRLFPCYHGHVTRHAKLFRHAAGQISLPEGLSANAKVSSQALASVNFSTISPEAPNAYRIYVSHGDKSYEIFGDWASVKVHTFKRYLHQVYHIAPGSQVLSVMKTGKVMDDDINTVKCYGIEEDSVIQLRSDTDDASGPGRLRIPLDDL